MALETLGLTNIPGGLLSPCMLSGQDPKGPALVFLAACSPPCPGRGLGAGRPRPHVARPLPGTGSWLPVGGSRRAGQPPASEAKTSQSILKVFPRPEKLVFQGSLISTEIPFFFVVNLWPPHVKI